MSTDTAAPKRRRLYLGIGAVFMVVASLAATACTPSAYNVESRATASLYRARTGIAVTASDVSCSEGTSSPGGADYVDKWLGTCTVRGATFRVQSFYAMNVGAGYPYKSDNIWTSYTSATVNVDDGRNPSQFGGTYSFKPSGDQWQYNTSRCWGGGC